MPDNMVAHKHAKFSFKNESKDKKCFYTHFYFQFITWYFCSIQLRHKTLFDGIKILWSLFYIPLPGLRHRRQNKVREEARES